MSDGQSIQDPQGQESLPSSFTHIVYVWHHLHLTSEHTQQRHLTNINKVKLLAVANELTHEKKTSNCLQFEGHSKYTQFTGKCNKNTHRRETIEISNILLERMESEMALENTYMQTTNIKPELCASQVDELCTTQPGFTSLISVLTLLAKMKSHLC